MVDSFTFDSLLCVSMVVVIGIPPSLEDVQKLTNRFVLTLQVAFCYDHYDGTVPSLKPESAANV